MRLISGRFLSDPERQKRFGVALLAAGSSRRFGAHDKLAQPMGKRLLGEHAAAAIPVELFANAWVITSQHSHPCEPGWTECGFETVINARALEGMGTSVALAAQLADQVKLDGLLIALADMPIVPGQHFSALSSGCSGKDDLLVSAIRDTRMPPAMFGSDHFSALKQLEGDRGARGLLMQGRVVDCPEHWLRDIDTPEDFEEALKEMASTKRAWTEGKAHS